MKDNNRNHGNPMGGPNMNRRDDRGMGRQQGPGNQKRMGMSQPRRQENDMRRNDRPHNNMRPQEPRRDEFRNDMRRPPEPPRRRRTSTLGTLGALLGGTVVAMNTNTYSTANETGDTTETVQKMVSTPVYTKPLHCDHCGATAVPDTNGCCQYCGSYIVED